MPDPYTDPPGFHRHQCYKCDFIWSHSNSCMGSTKEHECPRCGTEMSFKYRGGDAPTKKEEQPNAMPDV